MNKSPKETPQTILIASLGGSPQPVRTAVSAIKPDLTVFVATEGTKASIISNEKPKPEPYSPPKSLGPDEPTLAELAGKNETLLVNPDEPDGIFAAVKDKLAYLKQQYPGAKIIVDYTGGTKSMSAGMVYAAISEEGVELQFMLGQRPDTTKIADGTEKPQRMATDLLVAERLIAEARAAMRSFDYQVAAAILERLHRDAETRQFGKREWRKALHDKAIFARGLHRWDIFDHTGANNDLEHIFPETHPLMQRLARLTSPEKEPEILFDLWLNALRRAERGRYDDAMARAYRMVEWVAQWRFRVKLGAPNGTSKYPVTDIPSRYRKKWKLPESGYYDLGLVKAWKVLHEKGLDERYAKSVYDAIQKLEDILEKRNHSILAHGYEPVNEKLWGDAIGWIKPNIVALIQKNESLALPEQLPKNFPD